MEFKMHIQPPMFSGEYLALTEGGYFSELTYSSFWNKWNVLDTDTEEDLREDSTEIKVKAWFETPDEIDKEISRRTAAINKYKEFSK